MKSFLKATCTVAVSLALLGFAGMASADNNKKPADKPGNGKNCKVWCPKTKLVCKPCKKKKHPPSSTCNPRDICCELEIVGWYDCTPKNGKCSPFRDKDYFDNDPDHGRGNDDGRDFQGNDGRGGNDDRGGQNDSRDDRGGR